MQRAILDANEKINDDNIDDMEVFSMDVKSLYPSLHIDDILDAVLAVMVESDIYMDNIDSKEMGKYLGVMLDEEEISARGLTSHIPLRTVVEEGAAKGKPTIAYLDCNRYRCRKKGQKDTWKEKWKWDKWIKPDKEKMKVMMALVMREQVKMMVTSHLYSFSVACTDS